MLRIGRAKTEPEHVGEKLMEPERVPFFVDAPKQEVGSLKVQERDGVIWTQGVRKGWCELVDDAGVDQKSLDCGALRGEDLAPQVLTDDLVGACDPLDERGRVVALVERERGELQTRRPTLGAMDHEAQPLCGQPDPERLDEVSRVDRCEPQVAFPHFGDLVLQAQSVQPDLGFRACPDRQPQRAKVSCQQEAQLLGDLVSAEVEVVNHNTHRLRQLFAAEEEALQHVRINSIIEVQKVEAVGSVPWRHRLNRSDEATPEARRVEVTVIDIEPALGRRCGVIPLGQQRGLAGAGGSNDEPQWVRLAVEEVAQRGAGNVVAWKGRGEELGCGEARTGWPAVGVVSPGGGHERGT